MLREMHEGQIWVAILPNDKEKEDHYYLFKIVASQRFRGRTRYLGAKVNWSKPHKFVAHDHQVHWFDDKGKSIGDEPEHIFQFVRIYTRGLPRMNWAEFDKRGRDPHGRR